VEKIRTCPNHCILYRKEYEFNTKCLVCGVSRYKRSYNHVYADTMKKKIKNKTKSAISPESVDDEIDLDKEDKTKRKITALVMWYLLEIDRLKCVFSSPRDVSHPILRPNRMLIVCVPRIQVYTHTIQKMGKEQPMSQYNIAITRITSYKELTKNSREYSSRRLHNSTGNRPGVTAHL
jgi:hypothetical protein